ncbi:fimbria/pilus outer membrane usher protein [Enterobacter cloacae]|uniref:fimbria/pilus outer membrane usher protein n=1 Tax=Enterobacter cloacae TaxID=550 RepID=UPI0032DB4442
MRGYKIHTERMNNFSFSLIALCCLNIFPYSAYSADWFNPAFLSRDGEGVADLSRFESGASLSPGVYRVDVWLNDEFVTTRDVRFEDAFKKNEEDTKDVNASAVNAPDGANGDETGLLPCLTTQWLSRLGIDLKPVQASGKAIDKNACVDFRKLYPGATSHFDLSSQKLMLTFPQAAILNGARGYIPPEEWDEGITAGLLNYTLTGEHGRNEENQYLNLESGLNIGAWRLRQNSAWTRTDSRYGARRQQWQNISTYVQRTVIPLKSELVLGDASSGSDVFDSLAFRGLRMYSSSAMYPDSQQGYAPTVRGVALSRSKVTIRQNGYVIYQNTVQAGAFEITDLNPTSSSGDLEVTVEAEGGGTQKYVVPYSSVPLLQREGRSNYELVAGRYRSGMQDKRAPTYVQGTIAHGLQNGVTIYGGTQLASLYKSAAVGIGRNLGDLGAVSADLTSAQSHLADGSEAQGQSVRFLYAKSLNSLGTNFQLLGYRYSTRGFYTLDEVAWDAMEGYQYDWKENEDGSGYHSEPVSYHNLRHSKKGRFQLNISQQLGRLGSVYVSGSQQTYWNAQGEDVWYQVGYSGSWHNISYNLSWSDSRSTGMQNKNQIISASLSIPFGRLLAHDMPEKKSLNSMFATAQSSRNRDGVTTVQTGVAGTLLEGGNLNYSVMQAHSNRKRPVLNVV